MEDTLYVTGRLRSVKKSLPVDGIPLKAYVYSGGIHLDGTTVTDSAGCYAFSLPDVWGEWNLQLKAGVNKLKSRYLVTVDRRFGPPSRRLSPYECRSLPFLPSYLPCCQTRWSSTHCPFFPSRNGFTNFPRWM